MTIVKNIQETVKEYVIQFYDEKVPEEYVYHDIGHIEDVVRVCRQLGVETMYRTTYNTHNNLSALADHKANLMLSINTIMISITVSVLVPKLENTPYLVLPTVILLLVCLSSIILATLSTRPKVKKGEVTLEDIRQKKSNLLFFGNFFNMKLEDFQWGMMEMIRDPDFQYNSMTRDLYFLGKVLSKKYRYLTYCYNIFMFGMIVAVLLFACMFILSGKVQIVGVR